jgi:hypothetical protein
MSRLKGLAMSDLEQFKDAMAKMAGAKMTTAQAAEQAVCIFCNASCQPKDFRDDESRREYELSKMCQKCQDGVFGP